MPSSLTIFSIVNYGVWKNLMKCFPYENKNVSVLLSRPEQRRIFLVVFVPEALDCIEISLYLLFWFVGAYRGRQLSKAGSTRDFSTVVTGSLSQQSKLNIIWLRSNFCINCCNNFVKLAVLCDHKKTILRPVTDVQFCIGRPVELKWVFCLYLG